MSTPEKTFLCRVCEGPALVATGICQHCGFKHMRNFKTKFFMIVLGVVLFFALIIYHSFFTKEVDVFKDISSITPATGLNMPIEEKIFINTLLQYQNEYDYMEKQNNKGTFADPITLRGQRNKDLQNLKIDFVVKGWIGKVAFLQTTDDGNIAIAVKISPDISLKTVKSDTRDFQYNTLIEKGSQLFKLASTLQKNDVVVFNGRFYPCEKDCFKELSSSAHSSLKRPSFLFQFNEIRELTLHSSNTNTPQH